MDHVLRAIALLMLSAALAGAACDEATTRARCTSETDTTVCKSAETCVWIHDGAGFFCAVQCSVGTTCPGGLSCKTAAASSCQTCQDVLDICD